MYEECEVVSYPIDCYEIARKLYYTLVPYSSLTDHQLRLAMEHSSDGFSVLRQMPILECIAGLSSIMTLTALKDNDGRFFPEIGHIYLGHFENDDLSYEEKKLKLIFLQNIALLLHHLSILQNVNLLGMSQ